MKQIFYLITVITLLAACRSSKDYLSRSDADKALLDAVKKLNKQGKDEEATRALPTLYATVQQRHLDAISRYNTQREITRWDNILSEYNALQRAHDAIVSSTAANSLVRPENYYNTIYTSKQAAAEEYYMAANDLLDNDNRTDAKKAYQYFKKSGQYVPGYKDSRTQMDAAYQAAIINVVINPVQDNSFFFNSGWGNTGYNYSNEYFQQTLIRELGGTYANRYPARFYSDWEARRENVKPDWVVDLTLRNLDVPRPASSQQQSNRSAQVEKGKDSSGKILYETVYASVTVYSRSFTARADMDINITELDTRRNITYNSYSESWSWNDSYASYSGDRRALTDNDRTLIGNSNSNAGPGKEQVLNELYRQLYPRIKNRITYAVDW